MPAKLPQETVRALLAKKNWEPVEGWEYLNNKTPIPGRCLVCGYEGLGPSYHNLKKPEAGACKECGKSKVPEDVVRTILAEKNWDPDEPLEYVDSNTSIPGRCLVCGYEGNGPTFSSLKQGRQGACLRCSGKEKHSEETVRALLAEKNWEPDEPLEYVNNRTRIPGRCLICKNKGEGPAYESLLSGQGACERCSDHGYNPSKPGAFYRFEFIDQGETFLCYGITNDLVTRRRHYGRKLDDVLNFQSLHFDDGEIPPKLEKQFHEIRKKSSAPASACGVNGTVAESFSLAPDHWELLSVFEDHWQAARSVPIGKS